MEKVWRDVPPAANVRRVVQTVLTSQVELMNWEKSQQEKSSIGNLYRLESKEVCPLTIIRENSRFKDKQIKKRRKRFSFPKKKAHPDQASFSRRFFAFGIDLAIIYLISVLVFLGFSEIRGAMGGKPGMISQYVEGRKAGRSIHLSIDVEKENEKFARQACLGFLKDILEPEEYRHAQNMSYEEMKGAYRKELAEHEDAPMIILSDRAFTLLQEIIVAYLFFILFFRSNGRTPGKRLLRLKVIDLRGRKRLSWYQSLERAHGYTASTLIGSLGFLQVLWDAKGLTMHDKIAGTTVIKLPKKRKGKRTVKREAKHETDQD